MQRLATAARPLVARRVRGMATEAKSGYRMSPSYISMAYFVRVSAPMWIGSAIVYGICLAKFESKKETTMSDEWVSANVQYRRFCDLDPMGMNGTAPYTPSYMK